MLLTSLMFGQTVKRLAIFIGTNGANPESVTWTQGRDGKLYGTTSAGGANGLGAFLRFDPSTQNITVYHSFDGTDGSVPYGGVTLGSDNNFYGTTTAGGSTNGGVLYRISVNGTYTVLHTFAGGSDGFSPHDPPIEATDGNLYGTTFGAGLATTIYKFAQNGIYNVVYTFPVSRANQLSGLIQGSDGRLYTAAFTGSPSGANDCGALVKIGTYGGLPDYYSFSCTSGGANPTGPLSQASDGNYYGTTEFGGSGEGSIYQLTPAFGVTTLYSFGADGIQPNGGLMQGTDGNLYGTTSASQPLVTNPATLYQWSLSSGYRLLYVFPQTATYTTHLTGGLMQHTSGLFYGAATTGGPVNDGFLFSLDMGLGPFVALVRPQGRVGSTAQILGQGLVGTTAVTFNGTPVTIFNVVSDTYMTAEVPSGATTGPIVVTTPTGPLSSNRSFTVTP